LDERERILGNSAIERAAVEFVHRADHTAAGPYFERL